MVDTLHPQTPNIHEHLQFRSNPLRGMRVIPLSSILVFALLCFTVFTYYFGYSGMWASVPVLVMEIALVFFSTFIALGQWFTWCNMFLGLMVIFHIGYYLPLRLELIEPLNFMPPVTGPTADTALLLFAAACLSFALGCCLTQFQQKYGVKPTARRNATFSRSVWYGGWIITAVSFACGVLFVMQIGGPSALIHLTYSDFFDFISTHDSRYAESFLQYAPVGLLLLYFSMAARKSPKYQFRIWTTCAMILIFITLFLGSRGYIILFAGGWAYLRHHLRKPVPFKRLGILVAGFLIITPWIAAHRNGADSDESLSELHAGPLAAIVEMGGTYRPLYDMVHVLSNGTPFLNGLSYYKAIGELVPLSGGNTDGFYRTNVWINQLADPISFAHNWGMGSSGIGEPFANFGYPGVVIFFFLLGWGFSTVESIFLSKGSFLAGTALTVLIIPMGFYIRDDIFASLRGATWPLLLVFTIHAFRRMNSRRTVVSVTRQTRLNHGY